MNFKSAWKISRQTLNQFVEDRVTSLAAALAYYALFSVGPLLVIIVGVAGLVFSESAARHQLADQVQGLVGAKAAKIIQSMMAAQKRGGSLAATVVGIVLLLLGATGAFAQLKESLNLIWGGPTEAQPRGVGRAPGWVSRLGDGPGHRVPAPTLNELDRSDLSVLRPPGGNHSHSR